MKKYIYIYIKQNNVRSERGASSNSIGTIKKKTGMCLHPKHHT